jgi:hypothetical protein
VPCYEHILVWERANGPVPPGNDIHHINFIRDDNCIENLMCIDRLLHNRIHAGWILVGDIWYKPCTGCSTLLPLTDFHKRSNRPCGVANRCKRCKNRGI